MRSFFRVAFLRLFFYAPINQDNTRLQVSPLAPFRHAYSALDNLARYSTAPRRPLLGMRCPAGYGSLQCPSALTYCLGVGFKWDSACLRDRSRRPQTASRNLAVVMAHNSDIKRPLLSTLSVSHAPPALLLIGFPTAHWPVCCGPRRVVHVSARLGRVRRLKQPTPAHHPWHLGQGSSALFAHPRVRSWRSPRR